MELTVQASIMFLCFNISNIEKYLVSKSLLLLPELILPSKSCNSSIYLLDSLLCCIFRYLLSIFSFCASSIIQFRSI